ncbi:hypothetical protein HMPREF1554_00202 [Porphyromonas gingivalis F0569]|nr:hypothetical protein HMPREF1553_02107 [Porphyromonas gingivalis F0568]ERJ71329.1 hypothetical protein HMPREF1554_00202 [Porphyromonas gingivalis F0569]
MFPKRPKHPNFSAKIVYNMVCDYIFSSEKNPVGSIPKGSIY